MYEFRYVNKRILEQVTEIDFIERYEKVLQYRYELHDYCMSPWFTVEDSGIIIDDVSNKT